MVKLGQSNWKPVATLNQAYTKQNEDSPSDGGIFSKVEVVKNYPSSLGLGKRGSDLMLSVIKITICN